jgi:spore coat protein JB
MNERNKNNLMWDLQTASFSLDNIRLFLDTHPFEENALIFYQSEKTHHSLALSEFEKTYEPLLSFDVKEDKN